MVYQSVIAKDSQRFRWPSWVIYDQSFSQERAGTSGQSWAKVDPSIYSLCFTCQTNSWENWCVNFQSIDHMLRTCPARPWKRSWSVAMNNPSKQQHSKLEICCKFNRFAGDCKYGKDSEFRCAAHAGQSATARQVRNHEEMANPTSKNGRTTQGTRIDNEKKKFSNVHYMYHHSVIKLHRLL